MLKKVVLSVTIVIMSIIVASAYAQSQEQSNDWYGQRGLSDPDRPYIYYPDDEKKQAKSHLPQTPQEAQAALEQLQESVKLSRSLAIMNPTTENLKDYVTKQEIVMNKSAMFTDQWRRMLWGTPELDYSLKHRPTDNTAIRVYDQDKDLKTKQVIKNIAETQGLIFFIRGDCTYCHAFAPVLKQFQDTYGLRIMTVTLDGGGIDGFDALPDNGISTKLGITTTPALFLADTRNKRYLPVGYGVMSISELESRFFAMATAPGDSF